MVLGVQQTVTYYQTVVDVDGEIAHRIAWILRDNQLPPGTAVPTINVFTIVAAAAAAIKTATAVATIASVQAARIYPSQAPMSAAICTR